MTPLDKRLLEMHRATLRRYGTGDLSAFWLFFAKAVWRAATKAERTRCASICRHVAQQADNDSASSRWAGDESAERIEAGGLAPKETP